MSDVKGILGVIIAIIMLLFSGFFDMNDGGMEDTQEQTTITEEEPVKEDTQEQTTITEEEPAKDDKEKQTTITEEKPDNEEITPFGKHGALYVDGAYLMDSNAQRFQLYGMSTHGIAWFPQFVNYEAFKTLRDDWNTNCIRIAMYTAEYNGYCTGGDRQAQKELVCNSVDWATELGMYIIIDWHVLNDQNPTVYKEDAKLFFDEISKKYASYDNIIYEICNEPNSWATWDDIKNYAQEVIPIIRANDKNAVIIVGTPTWSQEIDKALENPLEYENVMYALHFYAATHTDWLRDRARGCIDTGLPVFISEFGMCDASGNGGNDFYQAGEWMSLIKEYNISYICWNLANKDETSSVILSTSNATSNWSESDLSESGKWIRNQFRIED